MISGNVADLLMLGSAFVSMVCVCLLLWGLRDVRGLAARNADDSPRLVSTVVTLSWVSSITVTAILVLTAAYTARMILVRPLIAHYPAAAVLIDLIVYVSLTAALLTPTWLLVWHRLKLKDLDSGGTSS